MLTEKEKNILEMKKKEYEQMCEVLKTSPDDFMSVALFISLHLERQPTMSNNVATQNTYGNSYNKQKTYNKQDDKKLADERQKSIVLNYCEKNTKFNSAVEQYLKYKNRTMDTLLAYEANYLIKNYEKNFGGA